MEFVVAGIHPSNLQPHVFSVEAVGAARGWVTTLWGRHQLDGISGTWDTWHPVGLLAVGVDLVIVEGAMCLEEK